MTEIGHKIATASLWSMGGKLIARLIDFLTLLLLARLLTPEDFGLVAIAVSILVIVETILELPLTQALLCHETLTDDLLDTAFTLSLIRGGIIAAFMLSLACRLAIFTTIYGLYRLWRRCLSRLPCAVLSVRAWSSSCAPSISSGSLRSI